MDSTAGLFAHVSVVSRDMVSYSGVSLLSHSIRFGALAHDRSLAVRKWLNNFIAA